MYIYIYTYTYIYVCMHICIYIKTLSGRRATSWKAAWPRVPFWLGSGQLQILTAVNTKP